MFSADELRAITADLFRATSELLNAELVTAAHVTVLLIRQYLSQANRFGVELATDIAQLEDRRLLHSIKDFEETAFDSMPGQSDISGKEGRLQSINEHILKQEADRLKADQANLLAQHDKLRQTQVAGESRLRRGEETLDAVRAEKNRLEALVDSLSSQISQLNVKQKTIVPSPAPSSAEIDNLNNRILNLEKVRIRFPFHPSFNSACPLTTHSQRVGDRHKTSSLKALPKSQKDARSKK